jgi:hypothetical protein
MVTDTPVLPPDTPTPTVMATDTPVLPPDTPTLTATATDTPVPPDTPTPTTTDMPTPTPTSTPSGAETVLRLGQHEVVVGTVFQVPVWIENAVDMDGWTAEITYDPEVIMPTTVVEFTSLLVGNPIGPEFEEGRVSLGELGMGVAVSGDGVLAFVEFEALRPGSTSLVFGETGLLGPFGWHPHVAEDGTVLVLEEPTDTPVPPTATDTPTPVPPTDTPSPTVTATDMPVPPTETATPTPTPTPSGPETALRLGQFEVPVGSRFWVPISIESAVEMDGWTVELTYQPGVIAATTRVDFTSFLTANPIGPEFEAGRVSLGELGMGEAVSGDGVLALVEFEALQPGTTSLVFGETGLLGPSGWHPHVTEDGTVLVSEEPTPTPTAETPLPTATSTEVSPVDTPVLPPDTPTPTPDLPMPTQTPEPPPPPSPLAEADLNGDGRAGLDDALDVLIHIGARDTDADWSAHEDADVNRDGQVTLDDSLYLIQLMLAGGK